MNKFLKCLSDPYYGCSKVLHRIAPYIKDDELYVKMDYFFAFHKKLDLKNPKTFNEKLQWLKLHDRNPEYTKMVDKYAVKEYISGLIGENYVIPTIDVWDSFDEIDFSRLPNQFVMKCTHDSGGLVICKDKSNLDLKKIEKKISNCLKRDYYMGTREFPYKSVKPRIIAEEYMRDASHDSLNDYKVMCFNGKVKLIEVHIGRYTKNHTQDFYDVNWKKTSISQGGYGSTSVNVLPKPVNFDKMIDFSELITAEMAHCRIDWYEISGELYFGEITFYDGSGLEPFDKFEDDELLGSWIDLKRAYCYSYCF